MSLKLGERVKETTNTAGTGDITLSGAVTGFQAFSDVLSVGQKTTYSIVDNLAGEYEVGEGTYSATNTLQRDRVYSSTNSGNKVDFSSSTKDVFITYTAENSVTYQQASGLAIALGG